MKARLSEHLLSLLATGLALFGTLQLIDAPSDKVAAAREEQRSVSAQYGFVDWTDPFQVALLHDMLDLFNPGQESANRKTITKLQQGHDKELGESMESAHLEESLDRAKILQLLGMYVKFLLIYVVTILLTWYGVQTLGTWRFIRKKRTLSARPSHDPGTACGQLKQVLLQTGLLAAQFLLFCPAYVIAYSIRSEFNTSTPLFMILLGVVSNGLLIVYANKFYTFLIAESRKGYVETAVAKGLSNVYHARARHGIARWQILRVSKRFPGHVFSHIFQNARRQYLSSIKEQAAFLITGLIIIEMALNMHGYLSYEMLRQILYRNYDIVLVIVLGIFSVVKFTEIAVDLAVHRESLRYENP